MCARSREDSSVGAKTFTQAAPAFDFTLAVSMAGIDADSIRRALDDVSERKVAAASHDDPVVAAIAHAALGEISSRIRQLLRSPPTDPLIVGALVPLLANKELLEPVVKTLSAYGPRAAGQLVDALLDAETPETFAAGCPSC